MKELSSIHFWTLLGIITFVAAVPRVLDLDAFTSPDEPQWERNSLGFQEGLLGTDVTKLYQQPHPGITTTWLAAATIQSPNWGVKRLPLALALALSITLIAYLSMRLWGGWVGAGVGLILAIDPQFIAHSRILSMDALLAACIAISLLAYLLWRKSGNLNFLVICGIFAALSPLSKMSGAVVVLYLLVLLVVDVIRLYGREARLLKALTPIAWFISAGVLTTIVIFPTLLVAPGYVWEGTKEFFSTEHYSQAVHALGPWWYPEAIAIWSTPFNWLGVIAFLSLMVWQRREKREVVVIVGFMLLFFLLVQYSIKKGDRYLLPDFLLLDIISVIGVAGILHALRFGQSKRPALFYVGVGLVAVALIWQSFTVFQLHPHYLAYRNPWTRSLTVGRTMGWGEGLDVAADYLNQKPDAQNLLVAAYYESSFAYHFVGEFTSAERLAKETAQEIGADYVVLYRTMEGRAPERWETKVLAEYATKVPEHVIYLNGEAYVWIYEVE